MELFWKNVDVKGKDDCWPWKKGKTKLGYGSLWLDGKSLRAHRVALSLETGEPTDSDLCALHSCDNPSCCNPSHLRWGTHTENMQDAVLRKRNAFGEKSPNASISEEIASKIMRMRLEGLKVPEIADALGLKEGLVMSVYVGRSWAHLHGKDGNPTLEELRSAKCKRGEANNRVLTHDMIDRILQGKMEGLTCKDLADELGIKEGTASPVFCGKAFSERHGKFGNPTTEEIRSLKISRKALSFDETTEVIRLLEQGYTGASIANRFKVGKATISRIKASAKA